MPQPALRPIEAAPAAAGPQFRGARGTLRVALAFAALLAALSLVIWRQSRALEVLRATDAVRSEQAIVEAQRAALVRRVHQLESRPAVVQAAGERLGMRVPVGSEVMILPLRAQPEVPSGS